MYNLYIFSYIILSPKNQLSFTLIGINFKKYILNLYKQQYHLYKCYIQRK
ncbi:hypothetical protein pb186bvf_006464 [Paramecium bursaria]